MYCALLSSLEGSLPLPDHVSSRHEDSKNITIPIIFIRVKLALHMFCKVQRPGAWHLLLSPSQTNNPCETMYTTPAETRIDGTATMCQT